MPKTINWKKDVIPKVQKLLEEYPYTPTVRAIFYRLVSDNVIPNTYKDYKGLIQALNTAREKDPQDLGYISVYAFADTTRFIEDIKDEFWTPEQYVDWLIQKLTDANTEYFDDGYLTRWHNQPYYVEVMIEKNALRGAFKQILGGRQVRIVPNNGWSSKIYKQTTIDRLVDYSHGHNNERSKNSIVLYFGDYDPSGISMSNKIQDELFKRGIDFRRVGLNKEHIDRYGLNHLRNPDPDVKQKLERDNNAASFRRDNNGELFQIELDALQKSPNQFKQMVVEAVDLLYCEEINQANLQRYTPDKIDELISTKVKFLQ